MIRIFRVPIPASTVVLVLFDALLLVACYMIGAAFAVNPQIGLGFYLRYEDGWLQIALVVMILQLGLYFLDVYEDIRPRSRMLLIQQLCAVVGAAFLAQALIGYAEWTTLQLPQWIMIFGSSLTLVLLPLFRSTLYAQIRKALPAEKILFVGRSSLAEEIAGRLQERPDLGFVSLGYLGGDGHADPTCEALGEALGSLDQVGPVVRRLQPNRIVVSLIEQRQPLPIEELLNLGWSGTRVEDATQMYESVYGRVPTRTLDTSEVLFSKQFRPRQWVISLQSVYSFVLGVAGLILTFPLMAAVALLVKVTSPGPVLFRQTRVGLRDKPFQIYKFRSMRIDAEAQTGPVWAQKNDPRVTPIGGWLRKTRLDELPQFFNLVRGEMVLAGPRPERPEFCRVLEQKLPFYRMRHLVKPGITGWAQINYPYGETIEDAAMKLEYDLYYVKYMAPSLDAYIIFHTLKVMVLSRGGQ